MKETIYSTLNAIAPTFYKEAPEDYVEFPVIIYYFLAVQPLFFSDNSFSKSKKIVFSVDVWNNSDADDLSLQIQDALKAKKAILRNERDISEGDVFGIRLEFEIHDLVN